MNDERLQAEIQAARNELVTSGAEIGLQVAVIKNCPVVADAVIGTAEPRTGVVVSGDTLFWAASTAKGIATSVAHVLVERGELDYDMRVIDVWPEFGSHGKDKVTLRHVLLHTAGVPGLPPGTTVGDLCDWDHMYAVLADEEPWWEAGICWACSRNPPSRPPARAVSAATVPEDSGTPNSSASACAVRFCEGVGHQLVQVD